MESVYQKQMKVMIERNKQKKFDQYKAGFYGLMHKALILQKAEDRRPKNNYRPPNRYTNEHLTKARKRKENAQTRIKYFEKKVELGRPKAQQSLVKWQEIYKTRLAEYEELKNLYGVE